MAGLLAAFMAGMAANVSSFNTVFTYDIWQDYIRKDRPDIYYLQVGRVVTVLGVLIGIGTAFIASGYSNIMNYIQLLFSFFNAPLFATFIIAMFWRRVSPCPALLGWHRAPRPPRWSTTLVSMCPTSIRAATSIPRTP
jgi:SSS family solute:Na+ symporter